MVLILDTESTGSNMQGQIEAIIDTFIKLQEESTLLVVTDTEETNLLTNTLAYFYQTRYIEGVPKPPRKALIFKTYLEDLKKVRWDKIILSDALTYKYYLSQSAYERKTIKRVLEQAIHKNSSSRES